VAAVIPGIESFVDFVRLVDGFHCFLDIPEAEQLLAGRTRKAEGGLTDR
jgi:hypothetical protein